MFLVVEFSSSRNMEVVPDSWRAGQESSTWWPPYKSSVQLNKAIRSQEVPGEGWAIYSIRVIQVADSYNKARRKLSQAERQSSPGTDEGTVTLRRSERLKRALAEVKEGTPQPKRRRTSTIRDPTDASTPDIVMRDTASLPPQPLPQLSPSPTRRMKRRRRRRTLQTHPPSPTSPPLSTSTPTPTRRIQGTQPPTPTSTRRPQRTQPPSPSPPPPPPSLSMRRVTRQMRPPSSPPPPPPPAPPQTRRSRRLRLLPPLPPSLPGRMMQQAPPPPPSSSPLSPRLLSLLEKLHQSFNKQLHFLKMILHLLTLLMQFMQREVEEEEEDEEDMEEEEQDSVIREE